MYNNMTNMILCKGSWTIHTLAAQALVILPTPSNTKLTLCGKEIIDCDCAGALALSKLIATLQAKQCTLELKNFSPNYLQLLSLIQQQTEYTSYQPPPHFECSLLEKIGKESIYKTEQATGFLELVGEISINIYERICAWKGFHWEYVAANIYSTGIQALPIVGLLSFLIGVVLAYQMGLQLQTYGANILIAYLSGLAIFREFAPLITAIIVAGRTSSSFTAQLGSMKINEEIDALHTMGLSPTELLVLPKLAGLLCVFPLLIFWSDICSLLGAMFMSKTMLDVGYYDFLLRLKSSVGIKQMLLGLYKAPVFALLIALVGCFQGFAVKESGTANIGNQTTKSVVQALFLIIIADAFFSVLYSWMGL